MRDSEPQAYRRMLDEKNIPIGLFNRCAALSAVFE